MSDDHKTRHALLILAAIRAAAWTAEDSVLRTYVLTLTGDLDLPESPPVPTLEPPEAA